MQTTTPAQAVTPAVQSQSVATTNPLQLLQEERPAISNPFQLLASKQSMQPGFNPLQLLPAALIQKKENHTGLPDDLKNGIENLSGYAMDDVRVHYHSNNPAQLQALAYAQGTDIHVAPGQEQHLPHEAWHVVQQKQGRVQPTLQAKDVPVNDDAGLEQEADTMGAKALQLKQHDATTGLKTGNLTTNVAQRVRGGIEYTEDGPTRLFTFAPPAIPAPLVAGVARTELFTVEGAQISAFAVPNYGALGAHRNNDFTLLTTGHVSMTNDTHSSEWKIERHGANLAHGAMKTALIADIELMFDARRALANKVNTLAAANAGSIIALAPGNRAFLHNAPDPEGVFQYLPGASIGKAQITLQYTNVDTIERINLLNASKFLPGTKVAPGEDASRVAGTQSAALTLADGAGTTSFSSATGLLNGLRATSLAVTDAATAAVIITQNQVGLIKLMVLNDALAATMTRYASTRGEAHQKNIQRFLPKSRRDEYVRAVIQANITAPHMALLRAEINRTAAADAQLLYNSSDPGSLDTNEAFTEAAAANDPNLVNMINAKQNAFNNVPATPAHIALLKTAVLGANGATLQTWINRGAEAYTDVSAAGVDTGQYQPGGNGNVIRSTYGFTPVAGGNPGAVYEFREREIAMTEPRWYTIGNIAEAKNVISTLLPAVD
jgi:hypothetical protein